jgi:putative endopeptidase
MRCLKPIALVAISFFCLSLAASAQSTKSAGSFSIDSLDRTADPCVDFYKFACGGWMANNPLPADQAVWGVGGALNARNRDLLRGVLDKISANDPNRSGLEARVGDYYAACMDEDGIEKKGLSAIQNELDRIAALKSKADLPAQIAHMHMLGMRDGSQLAASRRQRVMFDFQAIQDTKDATRIIAAADAGGIGLPDRDYYFGDDDRSKQAREQYQKHVANMFKLMGESAAKAEEDAKVVFAIESDFAKHSLTRTERRDPKSLYHLMSVSELQSLSPSFSWKRYLTAVGIPSTRVLNAREPEYVKGMNAAIQAHPLEHWKTYLRWHLIHFSAPLLSHAFVDENFDFYGRKLAGAKALQDRWKRCINSTNVALGEELGQIYSARAFTPESKKRMLAMVVNLEKALDDDIRNLDWMSAETKQQALIKLKAITNKIGYPDEPRTYPTVKTSRSDYAGNYFSGAADDFKWTLARIGKPADYNEWELSAATVDAYYEPQQNNINFPAAILQPPYFDPNMDDAVNYGAIGGVIGHELTHGFDDEGRQYDPVGNLRDWWTPEDSKRFEERAGCMVKEYDSFVAVKDSADPKNDVHLQGKLTLGENAADNGGLRLAYLALKRLNEGKEVAPIDGFTPEQRVFLGWGQVWCANYNDKAAALQAKTNEHSVSRYRVVGVVQNMPEFQEAFGCKKGQPMVSENACRIW